MVQLEQMEPVLAAVAEAQVLLEMVGMLLDHPVVVQEQELLKERQVQMAEIQTDRELMGISLAPVVLVVIGQVERKLLQVAQEVTAGYKLIILVIAGQFQQIVALISMHFQQQVG